MTQSIERYRTRMLRVLDHIETHVGEPLDLDTLSAVAAFSKFHFHRQFTALFGISLYRYVQLVRLRQASTRIAWRPEQSITEIALDASYEAPDAFARVFRQRIGQSPSSFRASPNWEAWHQALGPLDTARRTIMDTPFTLDDVTICTVDATRIAIMEHRGSPQTIGATIQRFIAWRKEHHLPPHRHATFNLFHDDPRTTPGNAFRLDLCVETNGHFEDAAQRVRMGEIPPGRRAVLRITGQPHDLEPAALFLYRDWLPASGEEAADFPLYCQRYGLGAPVPGEGEYVDLFLPLR